MSDKQQPRPWIKINETEQLPQSYIDQLKERQPHKWFKEYYGVFQVSQCTARSKDHRCNGVAEHRIDDNTNLCSQCNQSYKRTKQTYRHLERNGLF